MFEVSSNRVFVLAPYFLVNDRVLMVIYIIFINISIAFAYYYLIDYSLIFVFIVISVIVAMWCVIKAISN